MISEQGSDVLDRQAIYIKNVTNGQLLVIDSVTSFEEDPKEGYYGYYIEFLCGERYYINIGTLDYHGDDSLPMYQDYQINTGKMDALANEILSYCNN